MLHNPIESLARCFYDCLHNQVSEYKFETVDWFEYRQALRNNPDADKMKYTKMVSSKISEDMLKVIAMFPQTFSDTSCGHGGIAGQAFTSTYVAILECEELSEIFVYSSGRLLYKLDSKSINSKFFYDISNSCIESKGQQSNYIV